MSSTTRESSRTASFQAGSSEDRGLDEVRRAWRVGILPPPLLRVSEWAQQRRRLSRKEAAEAGPWSNERTPYLVKIMDALSWDSPYRQVVFMKGAQVGGTECGNNFLGCSIDTNPGPMMLILPSTEIAKRISKQRLDPLFELTESLKTKISERHTRDGGNTRLEKQFRNGVLVITGANSPIGLRSMPARDMIMDELDAFVLSAGDEGDPVFLAERRTSTFTRSKVFKISTPLLAGSSRIERAYNLTDQQRYFVPCLNCEEEQVLDWSMMGWEDVPHGKYPEKVWMTCQHCGYRMKEGEKPWMLKHGEWRATAEPTHRDHIGFHLSSLYSPVGWFSWRDAVISHLAAEYNNDDHLRQVFTNTVLGLTYAGRMEQPEWRDLYERRESYPAGVVPHGGVVLTAGVDIQKSRIEVEVVAWGRRHESWSIDYAVIEGDTTQPSVWSELRTFLEQEFRHEGGQPMPIRAFAIDTGFRTQAVYEFAAAFPQPQYTPRAIYISAPRTCIPVKGRDDDTAILLSSKRIVHKQRITALRLYAIGVSYLKEELYNWLRQRKPTDREIEEGVVIPAGFAHFPEYDEQWFKGLTAEKRVMTTKNGRGVMTWVKEANVANEPLDCRIYARAAAAMFGLDRMSAEEFDRLEAPLLHKSVPSMRDLLGSPVQSTSSDPYLGMGDA